MDESRDNAESALTPFVRQFRRLARMAAADPLRLMPPDPLVRIASLSAPFAELMAFAPVERLRSALQTPAPQSRTAATRARVHELPGRTVRPKAGNTSVA